MQLHPFFKLDTRRGHCSVKILATVSPWDCPLFPLCGFQRRSRHFEKQKKNFLPLTGIEPIFLGHLTRILLIGATLFFIGLQPVRAVASDIERNRRIKTFLTPALVLSFLGFVLRLGPALQDLASFPESRMMFNLLKPTGHVMHQQFNIQQLYVLPTLYLCVLYLSENKQRIVSLTA